jgi:hypothetical protein
MKHLIGYTQNSLAVYVDLVASEAAKHIARNPRLLTLAEEVLRQTAPDKPVVSIECDLGRDVGHDFIVKTAAADTVFYAQRTQEAVYTRFTKNGNPLPTSYVTVVLQREQESTAYTVSDIRIGRLNPPRPGDAKETDESKSYWQEHAFVFDNQPIQPRTLTKECPY